MKPALKNILVILFAFCYCLAVGGSGNEDYTTEIRQSGPSEAGFSVNTLEKIAVHLPQSTLSDAFSKHAQPQHFKLSFHTLALPPQIAGRFISQPFRQYVRRSQNMLILSVADIIYPFHSFW